MERLFKTDSFTPYNKGEFSKTEEHNMSSFKAFQKFRMEQMEKLDSFLNLKREQPYKTSTIQTIENEVDLHVESPKFCESAKEPPHSEIKEEDNDGQSFSFYQENSSMIQKAKESIEESKNESELQHEINKEDITDEFKYNSKDSNDENKNLVKEEVLTKDDPQDSLIVKEEEDTEMKEEEVEMKQEEVGTEVIDELDLSCPLLANKVNDQTQAQESTKQLVETIEKIMCKTEVRALLNRFRNYASYRKEYDTKIYNEFTLRRLKRIFICFKEVCKLHCAWIEAARRVLFGHELINCLYSLKLHALHNQFKRHRKSLSKKRSLQALREYKEAMNAMKGKGIMAWYYSSLHKSIYGLSVYVDYKKTEKNAINKVRLKRLWKKWKEKYGQQKKIKANTLSTKQKYIGITIKEKTKLLGIQKEDKYKIERSDGIEININ